MTAAMVRGSVGRATNELLVPVCHGGHEACQMAQETGGKKNDFYHLTQVEDSTKANSGEKEQPTTPLHSWHRSKSITLAKEKCLLAWFVLQETAVIKAIC